MLSLDIRQFLEENKVTDINNQYEQIKIVLHRNSKEWQDLYMTYASFKVGKVSAATLVQFLTQKGTACAIFMIGYMHYNYKTDDHILQAISYFELYCQMGNPDRDGYTWVAMCYEELYKSSPCPRYIALYLQNLHLSAAIGHVTSFVTLGDIYYYGRCDVQKNLREARYYYKLSCNSNNVVKCNLNDVELKLLSNSNNVVKRNLNEIELQLLDEFEVQLNKSDYLLAYELKKIHCKPGLQDLQKLIENEYYKVIDLPKVLCNMIVSYLL